MLTFKFDDRRNMIEVRGRNRRGRGQKIGIYLQVNIESNNISNTLQIVLILFVFYSKTIIDEFRWQTTSES